MPKALPVLLFALVFPTAMTWLYFGHDSPAMKAAYAVAKVVQFSLPLLWWAAADRSRLRLAKPTWAGLLPGLLFGLAVAAAIFALYFGWLKQSPHIDSLYEQARKKMTAFGLSSPVLFLLFAVFLSSIHALLEEYYWRGFVFAELRKLTPLALAIVISSLAFMAHHVLVLAEYFPGRFWTMPVPLSLAIAAGGAVWAILYQRFGSVYPSWLSHALVDAALMIVGYDLLFKS
jgi:membrane protease YdiL (CAAX protease family)